jgi:periplasmic protein TonB
MRQTVLNKTFAISLLLHAGILGALFFAAKATVLPDRPLRVRIVEPPSVPPTPPAPATRQETPQPLPRRLPTPARPPVPQERVDRGRAIEPDTPAPPARRGSSESGKRGESAGQPESAGKTPAPSSPPPATAAPPSPPPQVASRPEPQLGPPPTEPRREFRQETSPPPDRGGLSLGGPSRDALTPQTRGGSAGSSTPGPSLRDQIASLGSGLIGDTGITAKNTIPMDSRNPLYLDYLGRLKARIQAEWGYPEEARRVGMGGELQMLFTLNKSGTLVNIRLLQSSGQPVLDNEALRAVKAAAPFDPFPPQMGEDAFNIHGTFYYHFRR